MSISQSPSSERVEPGVTCTPRESEEVLQPGQVSEVHLSQCDSFSTRPYLPYKRLHNITFTSGSTCKSLGNNVELELESLRKSPKHQITTRWNIQTGLAIRICNGCKDHDTPQADIPPCQKLPPQSCPSPSWAQQKPPPIQSGIE